jgi:aromatase
MGHIENRIFIAAPREFVFKLTNDLHRWTEMFTEYASIEILEERLNYFRFRLTTKPDEQGRTWSWVSWRRLYPGQWRIEAARIEPLCPFASMSIYWTYEEEPEGTWMQWTQQFEMASNAGFTDEAATSYLDLNSKTQMTEIKKYLERQFIFFSSQSQAQGVKGVHRCAE